MRITTIAAIAAAAFLAAPAVASAGAVACGKTPRADALMAKFEKAWGPGSMFVTPPLMWDPVYRTGFTMMARGQGETRATAATVACVGPQGAVGKGSPWTAGQCKAYAAAWFADLDAQHTAGCAHPRGK